jgi:hypothetical protein
VNVRYPPWDPKARLRICAIGCPYCWDDDPDIDRGCPCHEEERALLEEED